ncbi:MAG: cytochrome P450 [Alphaproteobacteria bacterium]|nr:cytochrome P450 [Alphaproteobacteria bacterium]
MPLPPGPRWPRPVQTLAFAMRPLAFTRWCLARYGGPFTLRLGRDQDLVFVAEPEHVRVVLSGQDRRLRLDRYVRILEPIVGPRSLQLIEGSKHTHHRRILMAPFRRAKILEYSQDIAEIAARHVARWPAGRPMSTYDAFERISLEVILRILFGLRDPEEVAEARDKNEAVAGVHALLLMFPELQRDLGRWSPWGRFLRARDRLDALLYGHIAQRRAAVTAGEDPADVLGQLILAEDEDGPLSDEDLRDELVTLIGTGHDTTAAGLTWTLGWLIRTPAVHERLMAELDALGPEPSLEALEGAPFLDAVVKEAMRISPVLPGITREVAEPLELGGWTLPVGTQLVAASNLSHHLPQHFADPGAFEPTRFLEGKPPRDVFYPFGGGPRMCFAWAFGVSELKLVLSRVLAAYTFTAPGSNWPRARWRHITVVPADGGLLIPTARRARYVAHHASA